MYVDFVIIQGGESVTRSSNWPNMIEDLNSLTDELLVLYINYSLYP